MIQRKRLTPKHSKKQISSRHRTSFISYLTFFLLIFIAGLLLKSLPRETHVSDNESISASVIDSIIITNRIIDKKISVLTEKVSLLENKLNALPAKTEETKTKNIQNAQSIEGSRDTKLNISLQILNGCGKEGITELVGSYLKKYGVTIAGKGNYKHFKVSNTFIISQEKIPEDLKKAASILGISSKQIVRKKVRSSASYILVLGKDYKSLTPFKK
ncbi:MAG: hypothetical protein Kow00108_17860 [Calditrichia bacterium]